MSQGRAHLSPFSLSPWCEDVRAAGHPNQEPVKEGESHGQPGGCEGEAELWPGQDRSPGAGHGSTHTSPQGGPKWHGQGPIPKEIHQVSWG